MKRSYLKLSGMLAALALLVTTANVNSACFCLLHQPVLPNNAGKLRKFMSIWILKHGVASLAQEGIVSRESMGRYDDGLGQGA